jgi:electron transport complex protein RnfE
MANYKKIINEGLWTNNAGFVQLLGLCPLLAVTGTVVNGLGLGIATTLILTASNGTISLIRSIVPNEVRIPIFVLVIASFVTVVEMLMKAFYYELYLVLGIFIPLIVTNCVITGRAEVFASKNPILPSLIDGFMMGIGFTVALVVLSAFREIAGAGTLFVQIEMLFGESAKWMTITVFENYKGFLLAMLPPGAFLCFGLLIALKKWIDKWQTHSSTQRIILEPAH